MNRTGEILTTSSDLVPTASTAGQVPWQSAMKRAIRSAARLRELLDLAPAPVTVAETDFPTFVPLEYLSRIRPGDPNDPLLRQVLPIAQEDESGGEGYSADPVGDLNSIVAKGLLHKYLGRALIVTTGACGVHCRYCFRRQFPYSESASGRTIDESAMQRLRSDRTIEEVILSGGDPLTLVDEKLFELIAEIESIEHVRRLRIHSRMPIVIPQRVTSSLVERLRGSRFAVWFVIHANHPAELDEDVLDRVGMLIDAGIPVLNQAVLLRGVNDDLETLSRLCTRLIDHRIQPYYLHQLDRVHGTGHFEVPIETGLKLVEQLRASLPGYAVPTYVVEESGQTSKTPLSQATDVRL